MTGRDRWSALNSYVVAVTAAGLSVLLLLTVKGGALGVLHAPATFWLFWAFMTASEIRPILIPRRGNLELITTATTFSLALLVGWGTAPAVLALAVTSMLGDLAQRKAAKKVLFNAAQYALALGVGGGVFVALGGGPPFSAGQLPALALAALVYLLINKTLVRIVVTLHQQMRIDLRLLRGIGIEVLPETILVGMAPLVLVVASHGIVFTLLLPLPMVGVYLACKAAIEADANRAAAEAAAAAARVVAAEQARLAQAEQAVARRLQESERLKENLLAAVSHELRTPLAGVLGAIATLEQRGHLLSPELRREFVAMAAKQGGRLKELIEELLLAATLEQVPSERLPYPPVDAAALARQAYEAATVANPGGAIALCVDGSLPVRAAPEAILQALSNLLDNAARYSPDGVPIRLEATRRDDDAVIAVEDAGPGVPPAERERIFERFIRLDASGGSRRSGGVGLGLFVARQLARAQGGDLELGEPVGAARGARFELRLPLVLDAEVEAAASPGAAGPAAAGPRGAKVERDPAQA